MLWRERERLTETTFWEEGTFGKEWHHEAWWWGAHPSKLIGPIKGFICYVSKVIFDKVKIDWNYSFFLF